MQNHFQKNGQPLMRRRVVPLAYGQLVNWLNSSKESLSATESKCYQLAEEPLELVEEKPQCSGWSKLPKGSATKRLTSIKVDPDYNPKINKQGIARRIVLTRGQLKKDQLNKLAMLLDDTPAPKPEQPRVAPLSQVPPENGNISTVWHSGNVCQYSLDQICNPETRQTAAGDPERWRSIEAICLHLRGIDVTGNVGILKGPVSFEDVFQVLGLDEQGEALVKPTPLDVKEDSPAREISVDSPFSEIETYSPPPLAPLHRGRSRVRRTQVRGLRGEAKSLSKSPRRSTRRTSKSTYRRR